MGYLRCYYSGVESPVHFNVCEKAGVRRMLTSYYQWYNKDRQTVRRRMKEYPHLRYMIDSGAHSFQADWTLFKTWKEKDFTDFVKGYEEWIWENIDHIDCAVELDIDYTLNMVLGGSEKSTIGGAMVERWQKEIFMPLEKAGLDIIYVWHENRGIEGWEDMCSRFNYVGLPGEFSSKDDFNKFVSVARRYTTRMHGMASTKSLDFREIPWASIDSITWKTGEMYGTLIDWDERAQKLDFIDKKEERPALRSKFKTLGFDADAIIDDTNYKEVTRYSLNSMRSIEAFYRARFANRVQYFELRLLILGRVSQFSDVSVNKWWKKFNPEGIFRQHTNNSVDRVRKHLEAISAVQNADVEYLKTNNEAIDFLASYFPTLARPLVQDIRTFQVEMSYYVAPRNPPAEPRTLPEHVELGIRAPRIRETAIEEGLVPDWSEHPLVKTL